MRKWIASSVWIALAVGLGSFLRAPVAPAFTLNGSTLPLSERHFRVHNNFADFESNDATLPHPQFPGFSGAVVAIWKGFVEWGSDVHGDGTGDPTGNQIGGANGNFDFSFQGVATGPGTSTDNVVSAIGSCSGGVVAFTENTLSTGFRVRFCDQVVWEDGPGFPSGPEVDIQGVATHHAGHALGLDHSNPSTVMRAVVGDGTAIRDLTFDDVSGQWAIYGTQSASKPAITGFSLDLLNNQVTLSGSNFHPTSNEVWFTNAAVTDPGIDPTVRSALTGSLGGGTQLVVSVPPGAGPGDVLVKIPGSGYETLSNAYPGFVQYTPSNPTIVGISPSTVEALEPGTSLNVLLSGNDFNNNTEVRVEGILVDSFLLGRTQLAFNMPQVPLLGTATIEVREGSNADTTTIAVVECSQPRLQLGNGNPVNPLAIGVDPLRVVAAGPVGSLIYSVYSESNLPSVWPGLVSLDLGNSFQSIPLLGIVSIGAQGWIEVTLPPVVGGLAGQVFYAQGANLTSPGMPLDVTNLQSILLVN